MFKVGDKVISKEYGRGIVCDIYDNNYKYPIRVRFNRTCSLRDVGFTIRGNYWNDELPTDHYIYKLKLISTKYNKLKQGEINDTNNYFSIGF